MPSRAQLGRIGEQMAVRHLERAGLVILARNWRCATPEIRGELDVVASDRDVLVVCEVKTRRGSGAGEPLAAVTRDKRDRLRRLATAYLVAHRPGASEVRFDAVAVSWPEGGGRAQIQHIRGVC
ncbi:MAG: YraN family protein [Nitriliruptorales bacterium]|nr:YraN family protein [Nitriliruptorales bacterium]